MRKLAYYLKEIERVHFQKKMSKVMRLKIRIGMFALLNIFFLTALFSQKNVTIKGVITDAETGETLPFATVVYVGNESVGTTTDFDGVYEFTSKWGTDSIEASFVGYEPQTRTGKG